MILTAIHVLTIGARGSNALEPLFSGALILACAMVALLACYRASWRSKDFPRPFWFMLGTTVALWSVGQALYLLNEFYLRSLNLIPNVLLFLFFISMLPLSVAVLNGSRETEMPEWLRWFDAVQVLGIVLAACLLNLDLYRGKSGFHQMEMRLMTVHVRNVILAIAILIRAMTSRGKARELYAPISFAFSFFTVSSWLGNRAMEVWGMRAGEWCDLGWSLPFAIIAVAAAQWAHAPKRPVEEVVVEHGPGRFSEAACYIVPFALSTFVIVLALQAVNLQLQIAAALILGSMFCFGFRTSFAQCHKQRLMKHMQVVLEKTKLLSGYLPSCAACKMIRNASGEWQSLESYVCQHTEAEFTHGICPGCAVRLYPEHVAYPSGD